MGIVTHYTSLQTFKHSNKHALSCLLRYRLKHTNLKCTALSSWTLTRHSNQILQSYPAPPPRGVRRDSHITSKKSQRYRDTDSHTHKSIKAALRRPLGCETRQSTYISKRNRDTDSHTQRDIQQGKAFKAALRRPPVGRKTRQPIYISKHNSCRDMKHKNSKPKPTLPSPALRKQSISLQHSEVQKYKEDSSHRQWC